MIMEHKGDVVIYQSQDEQTISDVKLENESVWLNLNEISTLLGKDKSVISKHLRNICTKGS